MKQRLAALNRTERVGDIFCRELNCLTIGVDMYAV